MDNQILDCTNTRIRLLYEEMQLEIFYLIETDSVTIPARGKSVNEMLRRLTENWPIGDHKPQILLHRPRYFYGDSQKIWPADQLSD